MTSRRSFMAGILAAAAAPAFARSESLMNLWVPKYLADPGYSGVNLLGFDLGADDYSVAVMLASGRVICAQATMAGGNFVRFPDIVVPAGSEITRVVVDCLDTSKVRLGLARA